MMIAMRWPIVVRKRAGIIEDPAVILLLINSQPASPSPLLCHCATASKKRKRRTPLNLRSSSYKWAQDSLA
jgi:hypothetical protein